MDNGSSAVGCDVCTPGAVTTVCFGNSRGPQGKSATDLTCCYPHPLRNWHFHRPLSIPRATGWQTMLNIETDWNCRGGEEICYFTCLINSSVWRHLHGTIGICVCIVVEHFVKFCTYRLNILVIMIQEAFWPIGSMLALSKAIPSVPFLLLLLSHCSPVIYFHLPTNSMLILFAYSTDEWCGFIGFSHEQLTQSQGKKPTSMSWALGLMPTSRKL